jgi:protein associated with RNAse G/E
MRKIKITSKKYDGSLRDEYEAFVYAEDDERLIVYAPPGTVDYDHRKQRWGTSPDGSIELYYKTRWYIVWHCCEQNSGRNLIYTHLAMPPIITDTSMQWTDLDLDYRVHLDGRIELLDEDEYYEHIVTMGIPEDVQARVRAACTEIERLYHERADPFNHADYVALYWQIARKQRPSEIKPPADN